LADEAVVDQRAQSRQHVEVSARVADRLRRLEVAAAGEHGETGEEGPLARRQQVDAPGDGPAQRLLPFRPVPPAAHQEGEAVLQPLEQRLRRQQLHPGRGQLDGERQPVEVPADRRHGGPVVWRELEAGPCRLGPVDEEADGLVLGEEVRRRQMPVALRHAQRRDGVLVLPPDAEPHPAADQDLDGRGRPQELGDEGGCDGHLLEVVQHQQQVLRL
jgi:hypothetical protein